MVQIDLYGENADILKKIKKYIERTYGKAWLGKRPQGKTIKEYVESFYNNPTMMMDVAYNIKIDELMFLLTYYFVKDRYKKIVDPTCGVTNYQFSNILDILQYWGIEYEACDIKEDNWSGKVCDVFDASSLPEGDVFVYEPPFKPIPRDDERAKEYNIDIKRTLEDMKKLYSKDVFNNFMKRGAKLIIARGEDFYYPTKSNNLYLFEYRVAIPNEYKLIAKITYKFMSSNIVLIGARLPKWIKGKFSRSVITSSTVLVYERKHKSL